MSVIFSWYMFTYSLFSLILFYSYFFFLFLAHSGPYDTEIPFTNCWISKTGKVKCVVTTKYMVKCHRDYTWWPYDIQNCIIQIGSWSYSYEELQFIFISNGVRNYLSLMWIFILTLYFWIVSLLSLYFVDYYERVSKKSGMGNSTITRGNTYGILQIWLWSNFYNDIL